MKVALIGGCMDQFELEIQEPLPPSLVFPSMNQIKEVGQVAEMTFEFQNDLYYRRRIKVGEVSFCMYVYEGLDMKDAVRLLLERYVNHEYASFVYASDN